MTSKDFFSSILSSVIRAPTFFLPIWLAVCLCRHPFISNLYDRGKWFKRIISLFKMEDNELKSFRSIFLFIRFTTWMPALIELLSKAKKTLRYSPNWKSSHSLTRKSCVGSQTCWWSLRCDWCADILLFTLSWQRCPRAMTTCCHSYLPLLISAEWSHSHNSSQPLHSTSASSWPWYTLCRSSQITFILSSSGLHAGRWWLTSSHLSPWHSYWLTSVHATHLTHLYSCNYSFLKHWI